MTGRVTSRDAELTSKIIGMFTNIWRSWGILPRMATGAWARVALIKSRLLAFYEQGI